MSAGVTERRGELGLSGGSIFLSCPESKSWAAQEMWRGATKCKFHAWCLFRGDLSFGNFQSIW